MEELLRRFGSRLLRGAMLLLKDHQLAVGLVVVVFLFGTYWHRTFEVNDKILLMYQRPTTVWERSEM